MTTIDVELRAEWVRNVGYRYDVLLDGDTIVRQSRDPEHEAARVLHARGLRGQFRTIDFNTGRPRMILDIEKAANLRTIERNAGGPTVEPYRPMSDDDKTRLRPPSLHQGGASRADVVRGAVEGIKRAGGETAEPPRHVLEDA